MMMMTFLCFPPLPPWPWSKVLAHLISQSKHVTLSLANLPTYHAKYSIVEPCHASSSFLLCCLHFCCGKSANKTFNGDEPNISELKSYCSAFYHFVHGSAEHWPVEAGCTLVCSQQCLNLCIWQCTECWAVEVFSRCLNLEKRDSLLEPGERRETLACIIQLSFYLS